MVNKTLLTINFWLLADADKTEKFDAVAISKEAQDAAKSAVNAFNTAWQELADGKSHIYEATVKVSLGFAAMLIAFWAIPFFNTIIKDGFLSDKTISELLWPIAVILMLALNNGALLSSTCLFFRNSANYINEQILGETINGIKVEQAIRQTNMNQALQQILSSKVQQCNLATGDKQENKQENNQDNQNKKPNDLESRTACIEAAVSEVTQAAQEYNKQNNTDKKQEKGFNWFNPIQSAQDYVTERIIVDTNSEIQKLLFMIFSAFQMGFVFLVEITSILNAYIAPVFLVLSLFPGQSKLIHIWLSGWLGLGLVKVSYTLIVGIATSSMINTQEGNVFLLPLLEGVLSPILALMIASGGGIALFNGLTSAVAGSTRFVIGEASKL